MDTQCRYCGETVYAYSEDPKDFPERDVCDICYELSNKGVPEGELKTSPLREEARKKLSEAEKAVMEMLAKNMEEMFEKLWRKEKLGAKALSKKDLAETFYALGMAAGIGLVQISSSPDKEE